MPTWEATLILKRDGEDVGLPIVTRLVTDESQDFDMAKATGGGYLAVGTLGTIQLVLVRTLDEVVTVRLDAQSDAGIVLQPGGYVFVFNGTIDAGAATNLKIDNSSGSATQVDAVLGGT